MVKTPFIQTLRKETIMETMSKNQTFWNQCYVEKDSKDDYNSGSQKALHPTGMALQKRVVGNNLDRYKPGGKKPGDSLITDRLSNLSPDCSAQCHFRSSYFSNCRSKW